MAALSLGETLDAAVVLVQRCWRTVLLCAFVVALPFVIGAAISTLATTDPCTSSAFVCDEYLDGDRIYTSDAAENWDLIASFALLSVAYVLLPALCFPVLIARHLGRDLSLRAAVGRGIRRFPALIGLFVVAGVAVAAGLIMIVLPGIYLIVRWTLAVPAMLVEREGVFGGLRRSGVLVDGFWWAAAGRLLLSGGLLIGVAIGVDLGIGELLSTWVDEGSATSVWIDAALTLLQVVVGGPLICAVLTITYFDLRVRREGFDLALTAERLGGPVATDPVPEHLVPRKAVAT